MMLAFALALLTLPILDILSLIKAGDVWGFWPTLGIVIAAGILGISIVRHQGLAIGRSVRESLNLGRLPVVEAFHGACILLAGLLLLFPGLVSDGLALLLLLPPVRSLLRRAIALRLHATAQAVAWTEVAPTGARTRPPAGPIIEGEYETTADPGTGPSVDAPSPALAPPEEKEYDPSRR